MAKLLLLTACLGCAAPPAPRTEPTSKPPVTWQLPAGFRSETIPFPLDFAPTVVHKGVEELRFAPGFFDPAAPGYWSYAFVWRTEDPAELDATALGTELTAYFRGLIGAVDDKHELTNLASITATARPDGKRFALSAHVIDAFKTKQPVDLAGWAERRACHGGAIWVFVLAPQATTLRPQLDALAADAACDQPLPAPRR
jgi:hypothetical protein